MNSIMDYLTHLFLSGDYGLIKYSWKAEASDATPRYPIGLVL